jgi:hypothetical protein
LLSYPALSKGCPRNPFKVEHILLHRM